MKISVVLSLATTALLIVYFFINPEILSNYIFPYIDIGGILFSHLYYIIIIMLFVFFIFSIFRKLL